MPRSPESLGRAVALVRDLPLRWSEGDNDSSADVAISRGWFDGAAECARILAELISGDIVMGGGFGRDWPMVADSETTVAPGLPCVATRQSVAGPDAEYRVRHDGVWREAVGVDARFLVPHRTQSAPGQPFDLLWFGESERYLLRSGWLEVEDLFGLMRMPATVEILDRILIRSRRVDGSILSDVPAAEAGGAVTVEVRRPAALSGGDGWRDASRLLGARADIDHAKLTADAVEARRHDGSKAVFRASSRDNGWSLKLSEGDYLFSHISLERRADELVLRVTLASDLEAMAAGMRGRLIFDLRADLVALG